MAFGLRKVDAAGFEWNGVCTPNKKPRPDDRGFLISDPLKD
ncbi:hypothetical protein TRICHSKD4_0537 [Roseibium sp. TrichSKD4]|nr:hypothetical protein TRICHSKD4_0537 [Roseibium sp. TrichSKD4]